MIRRHRHKFGAKALKDDGHRFPSKLEHKYFQYLQLLVKAGKLLFFMRQCPFHMPGGLKYLVDFVEYYADGTVRFVDVKGIDTPLSIAKRKIVEALYPVEIEIVNKV